MLDYHTHTCFSFDSESDLEEMIRAGIRAGLREMVITDHYEPLYPNLAKRLPPDLSDYERAVRALAERYRERITIRKGVELGLQQDAVPLMKRMMAEHEFDFVIASFHYMEQTELCDPALFTRRPVAESYRRYYTVCLETLREFRDFDVMGHVNIIDRYSGNYPPFAAYEDLIREILLLIIQNGKGIEFNASCFRYDMAGILTPSLEILRLYRELGGEIITVGSDTHIPEHVASGVYRALLLLRELGFRQVARYRRREHQFIDIDRLIRHTA